LKKAKRTIKRRVKILEKAQKIAQVARESGPADSFLEIKLLRRNNADAIRLIILEKNQGEQCGVTSGNGFFIGTGCPVRVKRAILISFFGFRRKRKII
jgi:hypothetical protein